MKLEHPSVSPDVVRVATDYLAHSAEAPALAVEGELAIAAWHRVFVARAPAPLFRGWRCLVLRGDVVVAALEVAPRPPRQCHTIRSLLSGARIGQFVAALSVAEAAPGMAPVREPALLRFPAASAAALWLRAPRHPGQDRLILLTPSAMSVVTPRGHGVAGYFVGGSGS